VAVLPFVNISSDPDNEYFSDGLTEELIDALTRVERLRVPARTSAFAFKGKQQDIREISAKLNVTMVVEGSVRKDGDKLRITAQLSKVDNGYHLWSQTYDREMRDALAVQKEIAQAIAATLELKIANAGGTRRDTSNPEAYNLYLRGRYFWDQQRTAEGWRKAVDYLRRATEKDPSFAPAYAGLSDSWYRIGFFDPAQPPEAFPNAEAAAKKALELDSTLSEAHTSLANIRAAKWDWRGAEKEFRRAIELNPKNSGAHLGYAVSCLQLTDRLDQGLLEIKLAQDLDPVAPQITGQFGSLLYYARRYDEAAEQFRKALELSPSAFGPHTGFGRIYRHKGMLAEAAAEFDIAESINHQNPYWRASLVAGYVKSGQRAKAEKLLEEWKGLSPSEIGYAEAMVMIYTGLGEKDTAFGWMERAYREHSKRLPWIKIDPEFDELRSDPRFHAVLRKMRLE
jgi:TolB-like protein/Tfp pilus assembly protein PilF